MFYKECKSEKIRSFSFLFFSFLGGRGGAGKGGGLESVIFFYKVFILKEKHKNLNFSGGGGGGRWGGGRWGVKSK